MTGEEVLSIKMKKKDNDAGAASIREYMQKLLTELFIEQESFSGKRPFGNSGWIFDIYRDMLRAGAINGKLDEEGCVEACDSEKADELLMLAIKAL